MKTDVMHSCSSSRSSRFIRVIFLTAIFVFSGKAFVFSQEKVTTVGIQIKPIFPVSFLGTGIKSNLVEGIQFDTELKSGFSGGMVIRHGFTDLLAMEAGLCYVKRKYTNSIIAGDSSSGSAPFTIIGYEIPVSLLVYIRLGEQVYMNASMGPSLDFYASSVQSRGDYFQHVAIRNHVFQPAVLANLGWELRTENSGYIYIGASYHRPFTFIYESLVKYDYHSKVVISDANLLGNYLTLDLRYFFQQNPKKKNSGGNSSE